MKEALEGDPGKAGNLDLPLSVSIGAVFENLARFVESRGGDGKRLRKRSLEALKEAVNAREDVWQLFFAKARQLKKLGRFDEASRSFRKALALAPGNRVLRRKYIRTKILAALAGEAVKLGNMNQVSIKKPTSFTRRPTRRLPRRSSSARIRKYASTRMLPPGA